MNPNYEAYCRSQGWTPEDQMTHDEQRWPGGVMVGFMDWMNEAFKAYPGEKIDHHPWNLGDWGKWVQEYADKKVGTL